MKRILIVLGTRPEAVKLAPLIHELRARPQTCHLTVCSTGQHREMLDNTLADFDLKTDLDLRLMTPGQHPTDVIGRMLLGLRPVLAEQKPDIVVVQGDTGTVMAAALAAFLHGAQVAHVEAGLRTRDKRAPFPEEVNRRVTGVVADYHFPPTAASRDNLLSEGVPPETIYVTGNTVIDALRWMERRLQGRPLPAALDPGNQRLIVVTAHRRESFGDPFRDLCLALRDLSQRFDDVTLIYPVHLNPNVQQPVREILGDCPRVKLVEPVGYATMVSLLLRSHLVLTDSGGIQEEAPALGKPVLVLREKTERPEAVAAGIVKLVGTDRRRIVDEASRLLTDPAAYAAMSRRSNLYGDGLACPRIADILLEGRTQTPSFAP